MDASHTDKKATLFGSAQQLDSYYQGLEQEISKIESRMGHLQTENTVLGQENGTLLKFKGDLQKHEIIETQFKSELSDLRRQLQSQEKEMMHKDFKFESLRKLYEESRKKFMDFQEEGRKEKELMKQQFLLSNEDFFEKEVQIQKLDEELRVSRRNSAELLMQIDQLNKDLNKRTAEFTEMQKALSDKEIQVLNLNEINSDLIVINSGLLEDKANFDEATAYLKSQISAAQETLASTQETLASTQDSLVTAQQSLADEQTQKQNEIYYISQQMVTMHDRKQAEIAQLEGQITTLNELWAEEKVWWEEQRQKDATQTASVQADFETREQAYAVHLEALTEELSLSRDMNSRLESQVEAKETEILNLQQTLEAFDKTKEELSASQDINVQLESQIDTKESDISNLKHAIIALNRSAEETEQANLSKLESLEASFQAQTGIFKKQKESLIGKLRDNGERVRSLIEKVATAEAEAARKNHEVAQKNDQLENMQSQMQATMAQVQQGEQTAATLESIIEVQKQDQAVTTSEVQALKEQTAVMAQEMATLRSRLETETARGNTLAKAVADKDKKFQQYHSFMGQEKDKYQRLVKKLQGEVQHAIHIQPLRDYLEITEREIIKVEKELKKLPSMAQQRPQLESVLDQLIEQRECLNGLVTQAQKQLTQYERDLSKLQSGILAIMPPMF